MNIRILSVHFFLEKQSSLGPVLFSHSSDSDIVPKMFYFPLYINNLTVTVIITQLKNITGASFQSPILSAAEVNCPGPAGVTGTGNGQGLPI